MIRLLIFSNYFLFLFLFSCSLIEGEITNKYTPAVYYQGDQLDTLMANLITYVYVKPKTADYITKFEPIYRSYYTGHINKFELCYYFIAPGNIHYYYMIRPARSVQGITRGVGGKFSMDKNGNIIDFEELFNTPVMPVEDLKSK